MKAEYSSVTNWLLTAQEPWVVYNTLLELVGAKSDSPEVKAAYKATQTHPSVVALFDSLATWPPEKPLQKVGILAHKYVSRIS